MPTVPRAGARRARAAMQQRSAKIQLRWVIASFLLLTTGIVVYNAVATGRERSLALRINVAARQRSVTESYIRDVLLVSSGATADPGADARSLVETAQALLRGGSVPAVQGGDGIVKMAPAAGDRRVTVKLEQSRRLIDRLVGAGTILLRTPPGDPAYAKRLLRLRVVGAELATLSDDTVGQMTLDAQSSLSRLVRVGVILGALGALSALLMAFLLHRLRQQQVEQFRSLVQNSSDLITVIGPGSSIVYQSSASDRVLGRSSESMIGTRLEVLVHPEDRPAFERFLEDLRADSGITLEADCRVRTFGGLWREMHLTGVNLLSDRSVRGVVVTSRDVTERRAAERELAVVQADRARLLDRTVEATEQERKRLAADLHDGPVQHLAAMELRLESLSERLGSVAPDERPSVERVQESLRAQIQSLRSMMTELRPPSLDERGLGAALRDHLAAVSRRSGLTCSVESTINRRLEPTYETLLYRVAQEALTNSVKHAGAGEISIRLRESRGMVVLEVTDDGVGFDSQAVAQADPGEHFGLIGMRERVEMAGGTWTLRTVPGGGTLVRARLPLRPVSPSTSGAQNPIREGEMSESEVG